MRVRHILAATLIGLTANCSTPLTRVELAPLQSTLTLRAAVSSALVRTVELPTYAAEEAISVQGSDGLILSGDAVLWADDPARAATAAIAQNLASILSVVIAPEPWPFADIPDVTVEVRVTQLLTGNDGILRMRGQYFVGGDGVDYPAIVRSFAHSVALETPGFEGIAAAQSQALLALSEDIARDLDR